MVVRETRLDGHSKNQKMPTREAVCNGNCITASTSALIKTVLYISKLKISWHTKTHQDIFLLDVIELAEGSFSYSRKIID